jgi:actin-like ATPase involved in cell morphogenesis
VPYHLGIDLGTTYTAAAIAWDGKAEIVSLGNRAATIPSVVFLRDDGTILAGEAASRRALSEPTRVAQEFKRRLGDPTPIVLGGTPYSAEALMAKLLAWVVERVNEQQGGPHDLVAVTYPANWGPYKRELLDQAIRIAEIRDSVTLTEPEAAAIYYATQERVEPGAIVAVYDLGGGTFDAVVLRKTPELGFEFLGTPEGIERLGGIDLDQAVFFHVNRNLGGALDALPPDDPATVAALARLREECVAAKEALSSDSETTIHVLLPSIATDVRLTRAELEEMIRPTLAETIAALRRAIRSADLEPSQIDRVLLVGGSSRIPLVAQMVTDELGRPVAVDAHPKHAVALGAAIKAADVAAHRPAPTAAVPPTTAAPATAALADVPAGPAEGAGAEAKPSRRGPLLTAVAILVLAAAIVATVVLLNRDGEQVEATDTTVAEETTTTEAPTTTAPTTTAPTTTTAPPTPPGPFVTVTGITEEPNGVYAIAFESQDFVPTFNTGYHVHFFWNTIDRATAGTNGVPVPGQWLAYEGGSPAISQMFTTSNRPAGATAICSLVANPAHEIADVNEDGTPDPDTGTCGNLP